MLGREIPSMMSSSEDFKKVLVVMPTYNRIFSSTLSCILTQEVDSVQLDIFMPTIGYGQGEVDARYVIRDKYNEGRARAIDGDYDYIWTVESDMLFDTHTLQKLIDANADIVYGTYVLRRYPFETNTYLVMEDMKALPLAHHPKLFKELIGKGSVVPTDGMCFGCTLISREVFVSTPFRVDCTSLHNPEDKNSYSHCDWYFALDTKDKYDCKAHLGVICGHICDSPPSILYPSVRGLWSKDGHTALYRFIPYGDDIKPIEEQTPLERLKECLVTPNDTQEHLDYLYRTAYGVTVELGTRWGASTAAFLASEKVSHLYSYDIERWDIGFDNVLNWTYIIDTSLNNEHVLTTVDTLFVDSDHSYEHVKAELEVWTPKLSDKALVIFHDTHLPEVWNAVREWMIAEKDNIKSIQKRTGKCELVTVEYERAYEE